MVPFMSGNAVSSVVLKYGKVHTQHNSLVMQCFPNVRIEAAPLHAFYKLYQLISPRGLGLGAFWDLL